MMTSKVKIHTIGQVLMPGVPLHVYAVQGPEYSVLIDTGIVQMKDAILDLCDRAGSPRLVLITHAHADHIGCNFAVKQKTGALFAASGALRWIEDYEAHYQEFCLPEKTLEYTPDQRDDVNGVMDQEVHVDMLIRDGDVFRLGDGIELHTIAVPGHKLEEVAFHETSSKSLFMGDLLLALRTPFFHGFQTARGFHSSLDKIERLINDGSVEMVYAAHHDPMNAEMALNSVHETRRFIESIAENTLLAATGVDFTTLWKDVCNSMNRQLEFRGYAMLQVQLHEMETAGYVRHVDGKWWAVA